MKLHDQVLHEQLDFLMKQHRLGAIKTVSDLVRLINMAYGDYLEFHPEELPEPREFKPRTISEKGRGK